LLIGPSARVLAGALGVSGPVPRSRSRNEDVAISAAAPVVTAFSSRASSARIWAGPIRDS
jgi:hypothetical protein